MNFKTLRHKISPSALFNKAFPNQRSLLVIDKVESIATYLTYECTLERQRPIFVLSDCALGVMWEIEVLEHEALSDSILEHKLRQFFEFLGAIQNPHVTIQVIFDSQPDLNSKRKFGVENGSVAQRVFNDRVDAISSLAKKPVDKIRLMTRRVFVTLRLDLDSNRSASKFLDMRVDSELRTASSEMEKRCQKLDELAALVEESFARNGVRYERCDSKELIKCAGSVLHDVRFLAEDNLEAKKPNSNDRIGNYILRDNVVLKPFGIQTGSDSWQVLSWLAKPQRGYYGLMARLLSLDIPMRAVVTIRSAKIKEQMERKLFFLRNSNDSQSERQRFEVKETLDRMEYGERDFCVGIHLLLRNENASLDSLHEQGAASRILQEVQSFSQVPLIHEKLSAPAVFFSCLPLLAASDVLQFTGRELSVLSEDLPTLLPLFGGFSGTGSQNHGQVMLSRANEAISISPRASQTSPHLAVLAGSGGGKSFYLANLLTSELAHNPRALTFIIDNKTSYEILARTFGEENGFLIAKPPVTFPNIFRGELDPEGDRLRTIVNVLKTAITITSPGEVVDATRSNLLSLSILKTFRDMKIDASTTFSSKKGFANEGSRKIPIPKLTDVVDNLVPVADEEKYDPENVQWLRQKLSPFFGNGAYARLFDSTEFQEAEPQTPGVSLYDLDGISGDKVLSTLTTLIIIADIVRETKRTENRGRFGTLVIEEAGVIGSSSTELIAFIEDAWKTFRKLGYMCVGLTNDSRDYKCKAGPRTIWKMSPNKVVLRMLTQDIEDALKETRDETALFSDPYIGELIGSLRKKDGVYSQALWVSDETRGTFTYMPTGFDYWLAASKPEEVLIVNELARLFENDPRPYFKSLQFLAARYPRGTRVPLETLRTQAKEFHESSFE